MIDFIEVYDDVLSSNQCKEIIEYIDSKELVKGTFYGAAIDPEIKDCWQVPSVRFSRKIVPSVYLKRVLDECVERYWSTHSQIKNLSAWGLDNGYNLQKYNPGQAYFKSHCENANKRSHRMLVWTVYLNTVTDGGGTYYENYDRTLDAVEGRCVLWPPYWTHHHNGIVSNTQTKYIAT